MILWAGFYANWDGGILIFQIYVDAPVWIFTVEGITSDVHRHPLDVCLCRRQAYYPAFGLKRNAPMTETILWIALTMSGFLPALCNFRKLGDLRQQSPIWLMSLQDVWIEFSGSSSLCSSICGQWHGGNGWLLTGASLCGSSIFKPGLFPGRQQSFHMKSREAVRPVESQDWNLSCLPSATFCP